MIEPSVSLFNVFNFANFGGAGNQLSGVLTEPRYLIEQCQLGGLLWKFHRLL